MISNKDLENALIDIELIKLKCEWRYIVSLNKKEWGGLKLEEMKRINVIVRTIEKLEDAKNNTLEEIAKSIHPIS